MFLVIIPILAVVLIGLAAYVHPIFERVFHTYDELNNIVDENLQGIRVVKSFNRESMRTQVRQHLRDIYNNFVRAEKILSFNAPTMNLCIYAALIVISWVGAQQIVASGNDPAFGLTTGDMTALVTYALQILMRHDDDLDDLRDGHHLPRLRRAYLPGAQRDQHRARP